MSIRLRINNAENRQGRLNRYEEDSWRCALEELQYEALSTRGGGKVSATSPIFISYCKAIERVVSCLDEKGRLHALEIAADYDFDPLVTLNTHTPTSLLGFVKAKLSFVKAWAMFEMECSPEVSQLYDEKSKIIPAKIVPYGWAWSCTFMKILRQVNEFGGVKLPPPFLVFFITVGVEAINL